MDEQIGLSRRSRWNLPPLSSLVMPFISVTSDLSSKEPFKKKYETKVAGTRDLRQAKQKSRM